MNATCLLACGIVWRKTADPEAGWELVEALESQDPCLRLLAQSFLVENGEDSMDLLESAVATGIVSPKWQVRQWLRFSEAGKPHKRLEKQQGQREDNDTIVDENRSHSRFWFCAVSVMAMQITNDGGKINSVDTPNTSSRWAAPLRSMIIGFGFFLLGSLADLWLHRHVASFVIAIADDALAGIGAGLLVLLYERRHTRNMLRQLEVIRLMNHHVRNSLQVISFSTSVPQQRELADKVQEAVGRIEWALREVLPGQREDISDLLVPPRSNASTTQRP